MCIHRYESFLGSQTSSARTSSGPVSQAAWSESISTPGAVGARWPR